MLGAARNSPGVAQVKSRRHRMHRVNKRIGWPMFAALSLVVVAFMGLSLLGNADGHRALRSRHGL